MGDVPSWAIGTAIIIGAFANGVIAIIIAYFSHRQASKSFKIQEEIKTDVNSNYSALIDSNTELRSEVKALTAQLAEKGEKPDNRIGL